jgi:uncharacterized membrane protein
MKRLLTAVVAAALGLGGIGCNQSPQGGAVGTSNTFRVTAPTMATTIKQGDKQTITLSVDRNSDFKQSVKLSAEAPKGLKADLSKTTVAAGDPKDVSMQVSVDKDAAVGDHHIKVTATPDTGAATTVDVKITVEATKG